MFEILGLLMYASWIYGAVFVIKNWKRLPSTFAKVVMIFCMSSFLLFVVGAIMDY